MGMHRHMRTQSYGSCIQILCDYLYSILSALQRQRTPPSASIASVLRLPATIGGAAKRRPDSCTPSMASTTLGVCTLHCDSSRPSCLSSLTPQAKTTVSIGGCRTNSGRPAQSEPTGDEQSLSTFMAVGIVVLGLLAARALRDITTACALEPRCPKDPTCITTLSPGVKGFGGELHGPRGCLIPHYSLR